jgi:hypothetical protein
MNHILQSSNSPTQEKSSKKQKCKTIESKIIDDNDKEFKVEITYDYTDYYGWDKWEISVWGYDYTINGMDNMKIGARDLDEMVKDIIREEEGCTVTFY